MQKIKITFIVPVFFVWYCAQAQMHSEQTTVKFKNGDKCLVTAGRHKGKVASIKGTIQEIYNVNQLIDPKIIILPVVLIYFGEIFNEQNDQDSLKLLSKYMETKCPDTLAQFEKNFSKVFLKETIYYTKIEDRGLLFNESRLEKKQN